MKTTPKIIQKAKDLSFKQPLKWKMSMQVLQKEGWFELL